MSSKRNAGSRNGRAAENTVNKKPAARRTAPSAHPAGWFTRFAHEVARLSGKPAAFVSAAGIVILWAATGSLFHYSDTWQLVINTGTTIVTFLMVFLIQTTQNRDTMALQVKLAELITALHGPHNNIASAEDMSDEDLEALHLAYRNRADETQQSLVRRHSRRTAG